MLTPKVTSCHQSLSERPVHYQGYSHSWNILIRVPRVLTPALWFGALIEPQAQGFMKGGVSHLNDFQLCAPYISPKF